MSKPVRSLAALLLLVGLSCALALPAAALFGRSEEPPAPAGAPVAEAFTLITYRDVAVTANFSATDPQGDPVTFRVTKEPARGRIDFASEGSAAFTYVPYEGKTGKDSFTFVAEDPSGNVSRPVTVKVRIVKPRTAVTYADLTGHPAQKAAIALAERGLFVGERLGETWFFRPDAEVTRVEFLALAMDAVGHDDRPEVERTGFADDDAVAAWARPYVAGALRTGAVHSQLMVEEGKRHQCTYDTGCGTIILGVSGSRIAADLDEQGGTLEFHYSLDVNTALVSENDVYVAVFPR